MKFKNGQSTASCLHLTMCVTRKKICELDLSLFIYLFQFNIQPNTALSIKKWTDAGKKERCNSGKAYNDTERNWHCKHASPSEQHHFRENP